MLRVWTVDHVDYATPDQAIDVVETLGSGTVVLFMLEPNRHGGTDHRSCAMWSFDGAEWWSHYIWDGYGNRLAQEKPH